MSPAPDEGENHCNLGTVVCRVLTAAGASVAAVNKAGHSAMDAARQGGNPAVEDCLLDGEVESVHVFVVASRCSLCLLRFVPANRSVVLIAA